MRFLVSVGLVVGAGALLQACGADSQSRKSNPVDGGGDATPEEAGGARNGTGGAGAGGAPKATGGAPASGGAAADAGPEPDASSDGGVTDASISVDATPEAGPTYSCDGAAWPGCAALAYLADGGGTFPISTEGFVGFAFHRGAPPIAAVDVVVDKCREGCTEDAPSTLTNGTVTVDLSTLAPYERTFLSLYVTDACGQSIAMNMEGDGSSFSVSGCQEFTPTLEAPPQ